MTKVNGWFAAFCLALASTAAIVDVSQPNDGEAKPGSTGNASAPKPPIGKPAAGDDEDKRITFRGQVLLPDGTPAADAKLYWPYLTSPQPQSPDDAEFMERAITRGDGRFEFSVAVGEFPPTAWRVPLFAFKPGFGPAWLDVAHGETNINATLQLVDDQPIRGRVIDAEGRPVARARVEVNSILASSSGKLDDFLAAWKQNCGMAWEKLDRQLYAPLERLIGAVTDSEGRFKLSGIGIERIASLEIRSSGFASAEKKVVNRDGFDAKKLNEAALASADPQARSMVVVSRFTSPSFTHVAEAELTVRGQVFTGTNRRPVADAIVSSSAGHFGLSVWAKTDAAGRYELRGLPRNQELFMNVQPPDTGNLLDRELTLGAKPSEAIVNFDVELKPGVVIEGRVVDPTTGKGVRSGVRFVPLPGNAFANQPGYEVHKFTLESHETDHEGEFQLTIIPGPGVLMAQAHLSSGDPRVGGEEIVPYRRASFTTEESKRITVKEDANGRYFKNSNGAPEMLWLQNAVKLIDTSLEDGKLECELSVDRGKTLNINIEDDEGRSLSNVFVAGATESWLNTFEVAEPSCTIYALGADRPRRVCLLHHQRRLATSLTLTGEESQPVTVRLTALASVSGQAIDDDGAPIAGAVLQLNYVSDAAKKLELFASAKRPAVKTDSQGRFQLKNIVPGERFSLDFKQGDAYFRAKPPEEQQQLNAGQTLDLGGLKIERLR